MSIAQLLKPFTLVTGAVGLMGVAIVSGANSARAAGFSGDYAPSRWTLTNQFADGFVDTADAPRSITLYGSDNGSGSFGQTSYVTTAQGSGLVSFDWDYQTFDSLPVWDPFGFLLNGDFTEVADSFGPNSQAASFSFSASKGDSFGFAIQTDDNALGPAVVKISNFRAPTAGPADVPEPVSLLSLLVIGAFGIRTALQRYR